MEQLEPQYSGLLDAGQHTIHWEYFGNRAREAVCLLNGLAMHTKAWYGFLPQLLDDYDVLLYDYPGQGESSKEDVPYSIPAFARYLARIMDLNEVEKIHLMGISYGGFVALDFARLYRERLHTLVLSGIILSHEKLFQMYQDISLRFYRSTPEVFDLYTHYMYEKIFGEAFVSKLTDEQLDAMRQRFYDRYVDLRHCLIRLTEAQDPFFAAIDGVLPEYESVTVPTLVVAGEQDRAIPLWAQRKLCNVFANSRWELLEGSGHVVYLERPDLFFPLLKRLMKAKSVDF